MENCPGFSQDKLLSREARLEKWRQQKPVRIPLKATQRSTQHDNTDNKLSSERKLGLKTLKLSEKDGPRRVKRPVEDTMSMREKLELWRQEKRQKQEEKTQSVTGKKVFKPSGVFRAGSNAGTLIGPTNPKSSEVTKSSNASNTKTRPSSGQAPKEMHLCKENKALDFLKTNKRRLSFTIQEGASPLVKESQLAASVSRDGVGINADVNQKGNGNCGDSVKGKTKRQSLSTKHRLSFGATVHVGVVAVSDKRKSMSTNKRYSLAAQAMQSRSGLANKRKSLPVQSVRSGKPGLKASHCMQQGEGSLPGKVKLAAGAESCVLSQKGPGKNKGDIRGSSVMPVLAKKRASLDKKSVRKAPTLASGSRRSSLSKRNHMKGRRQTMAAVPTQVTQVVPKSAMRKSLAPTITSNVRTDVDGAEGNRVGVVMPNVRNVRFVTPVGSSTRTHGTLRKTPRVETSMREKLDSWLKAKGKTPSRFRHLMFFGAHLSAKQKGKQKEPATKRSLSVAELTEQQAHMAAESEDVLRQNLNFDSEEEEEEDREDSGIQSQLRDMLEECTTLYEAGCPAPSIFSWLDEIESSVSTARQSAEYWVVRAKVTEGSGSENDVLDVFEEAMKADAKPPEPIVQALQEFVLRMEERCKAKGIAMTPRQPLLEIGNISKDKTTTPSHLQVKEGNVFESSAIKYCIKEQTPYFQRLKAAVSDSVQSPIQLCAVVTPVRRSTRKSCANLPRMLLDHDTVVSSVNDIPEDMKETVLFKPNKALNMKLEDSIEQEQPVESQ